MAITISVVELLDALRLGSSAEELAQVTRLHGYATAAVSKHAPAAEDVVHNEAVVRLAAYLYDQPSTTRADGFSNALRSSGAARILLPYRIHRAGSTAEAVEVAMSTGSVGNPVTDVTVLANILTVSYADGTSASFTLAVGGGGSGVDQTARDAADAAQGEIDAHETSEHNTDSTARGAADAAQADIDAHETSEHNTDATARAKRGNGASGDRRPRTNATRRRRRRRPDRSNSSGDRTIGGGCGANHGG